MPKGNVKPKGAGLHRRSFPIQRFEQLEDGRLLVEGTCTTEAVVDGIVLDFDAMSAAAETNYKGNLREMHNRVAVGRAIEVMPDADSRSIRLRAFVSKGAPDTQAKVLDGTLQGFSVGVDPLEMRSEDGGIKRATKVDWAETSLVDVGADPHTNDLSVVTLCRGAEYTPALVGKEDSVETTSVQTAGTSAEAPVNRFKDILRAAAEPAKDDKSEEARAGDCTCGCAECGTGKDGDGEECGCGCETCKGKDVPDDGAEEEKFRADEPAVENAEQLEDARAKCTARMEYLDGVAEKLGVESKRSRRKAFVERLAKVGAIQRHSEWGTEYDDISFAIGLACNLEWTKRDLAALMGSEMAEGAGEGDEAGQAKSLQEAVGHVESALASIQAFIGSEAAELLAEEMEEVAEPPAQEAAESAPPVEPVANAKRVPKIARNVTTKLITRRLDRLERAVTEKTVLTTTDGELMTAALGEKLAEINRASSKAFGDLLNEVKAVRGDVEIIKAQPVPGGPVKLARAAMPTAGSSSMSVAALEDALNRAPDPVTAGFLRVEIARAKAAGA